MTEPEPSPDIRESRKTKGTAWASPGVTLEETDEDWIERKSREREEELVHDKRRKRFLVVFGIVLILFVLASPTLFFWVSLHDSSADVAFRASIDAPTGQSYIVVVPRLGGNGDLDWIVRNHLKIDGAGTVSERSTDRGPGLEIRGEGPVTITVQWQQGKWGWRDPYNGLALLTMPDNYSGRPNGSMYDSGTQKYYTTADRSHWSLVTSLDGTPPSISVTARLYRAGFFENFITEWHMANGSASLGWSRLTGLAYDIADP